MSQTVREQIAIIIDRITRADQQLVNECTDAILALLREHERGEVAQLTKERDALREIAIQAHIAIHLIDQHTGLFASCNLAPCGSAREVLKNPR